MRKIGHLIAGTALSAGLGVASAGEAPTVLGSVEYQAMSAQEMTQVTGEAGGKHRRRGRIVNVNNNTNTNTACAALVAAVCAGDDITISILAAPPA
jgi:hypothetical protein